MRKLLLASLALIGLGAAGPALAADMRLKAPVYKAPPPVAAYNWTGCYAGGNAGHIRSKGDVALRPSGAFNDPFDIFSDPVIQDPLTRSYATGGSGFVGGVQVGCNLQLDRLVLGLEADFNRSTLKETTDAHYDPIGLPSPLSVDIASRAEQVTKSLDWLSTVRARVGVAVHDRFLVYGTAGLALARITSTTSVVFGPDGALLANLRFVGGETRTRRAAVVGGGAEFAVTPNWSLKAEYLFMNFGAFGYETPQSGPVPFFTPAFTWATAAGDTRVHIARVGLNYKFDLR